MPKPSNDEDNLNEEEIVEDDEQLEEDDSQEDLQDEQQDENEDEQQEEDGQDDQEDESEQEEPEDKKPSRREQLRINDLLRKYGPPSEREDTSKQDGINFRDIVDADDDTLEQLDKTSREYAEKRHNDGLAKAQYLNWETSLKIDTPVVFANHPQMKDERVSASVNAEYLNFVGYDEKKGTVARPDVSYADFVDARMEQAQAIAEAMTERTRKTVTRQAARTAIRPDGSSPSKRLDLSKSPQDMTDQELDAYLAQSGFAPKK